VHDHGACGQQVTAPPAVLQALTISSTVNLLTQTITSTVGAISLISDPDHEVQQHQHIIDLQNDLGFAEVEEEESVYSLEELSIFNANEELYKNLQEEDRDCEEEEADFSGESEANTFDE
jgi:hypothetical protein